MSVRLDAVGDTLTRTATVPAATQNVSFGGFCRIAVDRNSNSGVFSLDLSTSSGQFLILETDADGTSMGLWNSGGVSPAGPNMVVGDWYFLCACIAGTVSTLHWRRLTGVPATALTTATGVNAGSFAPTSIRVGRSNFAGEFWNGNVLGWRLWTATLSAKEVLRESYSIAPKRRDQLWAWWPLLDVLTAGQDFSCRGRPLTVAGTLTVERSAPVTFKGLSPQVLQTT